ncbi:(2Fe-2S)-binding protein [Patescibacteria group bacterium]|nr:(2Fe-2S)-binding protein [Patescibacteria group bacterium]
MPKVTFKNTGEEAEVEAGAKLMDVTRDKGWSIAYGCEDGMCGTCIISVVSGMENLNEVSDKEKDTLEAMGMDPSVHRLACQCKVNGDVVIEQ